MVAVGSEPDNTDGVELIAARAGRCVGSPAGGSIVAVGESFASGKALRPAGEGVWATRTGLSGGLKKLKEEN